MWCPINWGSIVSVAQEYVERLSRDEVRTDTYPISRNDTGCDVISAKASEWLVGRGSADIVSLSRGHRYKQ